MRKQFTATPNGFSCSPRSTVSRSNAAFDTPYVMSEGITRTAAIDDRLRIEPSPRSRISGMASRIASHGAR